MKAAHILYALGALLLFGGGGYMVLSDARGIRNKNPLNIEKTSEQWLGAVGDDGRFIVFESHLHGLRAGARILRTYSVRYGIDTIAGIVSRWAPPSENNTAKYIDFVAQSAQVHPDKKLSMGDYPHVIAAMVRMENGEQPYSMADIQKAFEWGFYG